jgi:hypothetical protein
MKQLRDLLLASVVLTVVVTAVFFGCGGEDLVVGGHLPLTPTSTGPTATPGCAASGETCSFSSQCCSGTCLITLNECQ